jgi:hypothetical protein
MSGAMPPIPHHASKVWCLVKAQGQLYLYYYLGNCTKYEAPHYVIFSMLRYLYVVEGLNEKFYISSLKPPTKERKKF